MLAVLTNGGGYARITWLSHNLSASTTCSHRSGACRAARVERRNDGNRQHAQRTRAFVVHRSPQSFGCHARSLGLAYD
jgi:hypothetical protein